ncbi:hypothetical protein AAL_04043 [Moelleriella libera RCEF 2490]|uniref:Uncharacterized protein n=1 Tax=Moelleriella libera RCEF 2490 TaxID=1081109 RepID=A0A168CN79_9HYPO|nr:hypothetical protein AAL_04043 [Moelleriella libera RCEF 2490]
MARQERTGKHAHGQHARRHVHQAHGARGNRQIQHIRSQVPRQARQLPPRLLPGPPFHGIIIPGLCRRRRRDLFHLLAVSALPRLLLTTTTITTTIILPTRLAVIPRNCRGGVWSSSSSTRRQYPGHLERCAQNRTHQCREPQPLRLLVQLLRGLVPKDAHVLHAQQVRQRQRLHEPENAKERGGHDAKPRLERAAAAAAAAAAAGGVVAVLVGGGGGGGRRPPGLEAVETPKQPDRAARQVQRRREAQHARAGGRACRVRCERERARQQGRTGREDEAD